MCFQILKELPSEAKCSIHIGGTVTPFPCVAGDYSDQRWPLGTFLGSPRWLGDSCTSVVMDFSSNIALVPRGGCSFRDKALVLQTAGYKCAILVDFESDTPLTPALGENLDIAVVMVTRDTGMRLVQRDDASTCDSVRVSVEFLRTDQLHLGV